MSRVLKMSIDVQDATSINNDLEDIANEVAMIRQTLHQILQYQSNSDDIKLEKIRELIWDKKRNN